MPRARDCEKFRVARVERVLPRRRRERQWVRVVVWGVRGRRVARRGGRRRVGRMRRVSVVGEACVCGLLVFFFFFFFFFLEGSEGRGMTGENKPFLGFGLAGRRVRDPGRGLRRRGVTV